MSMTSNDPEALNDAYIESIIKSVESYATTSTVNKKVDLVFVVDIGISMKYFMNTLKQSIQNTLDELQDKYGLDVQVSIVEYGDIDYRGFVTINGQIAKTVIDDPSACFMTDEAEINKMVESLEAYHVTGHEPADISDSYNNLDSSTPLAALGYVANLPYRAGTNKFTVLITNKTFNASNHHGYKGRPDMTKDFNDKNISLSVSSFGLGIFTLYDNWAAGSNGIKLPINRSTPFLGKYGDFIAANLTNEKEYTILASNTLKEIKLDAPLVKGGATDTDHDGLTDSQEVDWMHVKTGELPYALPTLEELWSWNQEDYDEAEIGNIPYIEELKGIQVLPLKSDPMLQDSDDDGLMDKEDELPFINDFKAVWYKFTLDGKTMYLYQGKYGSQNTRYIDFEAKKIYALEEEKLVETEEQPEDIGLKNGLVAPTQVSLFESTEQDLVIDVDLLLDRKEMVGEIEGQYGGESLSRGALFEGDQDSSLEDIIERQKMRDLGILTGIVDSFFPEQGRELDINEITQVFLALQLMAITGGIVVPNTYLPSNRDIKVFIWRVSGIEKETDLDNSLEYLQAKSFTEMTIAGSMYLIAGYQVIEGIASVVGGFFCVAGAAGITFGTGGLAVAVSWEVAIGGGAIALVNTAKCAANVEIACSIGQQAGRKGSEDQSKVSRLEDNAEISVKIKKIVDKIPNKFKVNGECDGFAKKLVEGLKSKEINYEIIRIDSKAGIYSDKAGTVIGQGYHYGIKVDNMIYDNMTLKGMKFDDWLIDLGADGSFADITWKVTDIILTH